MNEQNATVSLSVPASAASIAFVRSVVASVAASLALTYDTVDDLRIAVAEACAMVLADGTGDGGRICIDLTPGDAELRMQVWREGSGTSSRFDHDGLAWRVIEGLTDGAKVGEVDGNTSVDLVVRTVSA